MSKELLRRIARARDQLDQNLRALRHVGATKADVRAIRDLIEVANSLEVEARELAKEKC